MRDFQRSKLYAAERHLAERGPRLESVKDIQAFVDGLCQSRWFRNRFGLVEIAVRDGRGRRNAGGCGWRSMDGRGGFITLPKWSRHTLFILHEITHVIIPSNLAAHGREFSKIFLQLVGRWMGDDSAKDLRAAYRRCGVKYVVRGG